MKKFIFYLLIPFFITGLFAENLVHIQTKNGSELETKYSRILMKCLEEQGVKAFYDNEQTDYFFHSNYKSYSNGSFYYCVIDSDADVKEKEKYLDEKYGLEKHSKKLTKKEFKELGLSFEEPKTVLYFNLPSPGIFFDETEDMVRFFYNVDQTNITDSARRNMCYWLNKTDDEELLKEFFTKIIYRSRNKTEKYTNELDYLDTYLSFSGSGTNVAVTEDNRCIVGTSRELIELGLYGELRKDLLEGLPEEDKINIEKELKTPYIMKNENLIVGICSDKYVVYNFSKDGNYKNYVFYNPSKAFSSEMRFRSNGDPFDYSAVYSEDKQTTSSLESLLKEVNLIDESQCYPCPLGGFYYYNKESYLLYKIDDDYKITSIIPVDYINSNEIRLLTRVFEDGSFCLRDSSYDSHIFSSEGKYLWTIPDGYGRPASIRNGIVYCENGSRFIYDETLLPEDLRIIGKNNRLVNKDIIKNSRYLYENAMIYFNHEAYTQSEKYLEKYLQYNAGDSTAQELKLKLKIRREKEECAVLSEEAVTLFDYYGRENGYDSYHKAMIILEQLVKQVPNDMEVLEMYSELQKRFIPEMKVSNQIPELEILEVSLSSIFPALLNVYTDTPAGSVLVKNNGDSPARNISIKAYVKNYMDFASESTVVPELLSGEEGSLEIKLLFNNKILNVNENRQIQVQYIISWDQNGESQTISLVRPAMIYKKSAMTWMDTRMLSCFIQADDPVVQKFAFNVMDQKTNTSSFISRNFFSAVKLADTLGSLPVNYVSDPVSPVTIIMDNPYAIDTVRFAKETLNYRGGDCDDLTVLYCSLLESIGIPSAVITIPGHIFAAFNAGVKYNQIWEKLQEKYTVLENNGETWIPVEITALSSGFRNAWETASKEIRSAEENNDEIEFILISEARNVYPSVSYDEFSNFDFPKAVDNLSDKDIESIREEVFVPKLKELVKTKDTDVMNLAAKFYYSLSYIDESISVLEEAFQINSNNYKVVKNLESLYKLTGETEKLKKLGNHSKNFQKNMVQSKSKKDNRADEKNSEFEWLE